MEVTYTVSVLKMNLDHGKIAPLDELKFIRIKGLNTLKSLMIELL